MHRGRTNKQKTPQIHLSLSSSTHTTVNHFLQVFFCCLFFCCCCFVLFFVVFLVAVFFCFFVGLFVFWGSFLWSQFRLHSLKVPNLWHHARSWWHFPRLQGFGENVQPFIPCLCFFFFKWRLARSYVPVSIKLFDTCQWTKYFDTH